MDISGYTKYFESINKKYPTQGIQLVCCDPTLIEVLVFLQSLEFQKYNIFFIRKNRSKTHKCSKIEGEINKNRIIFISSQVNYQKDVIYIQKSLELHKGFLSDVIIIDNNKFEFKPYISGKNNIELKIISQNQNKENIYKKNILIHHDNGYILHDDSGVFTSYSLGYKVLWSISTYNEGVGTMAPLIVGKNIYIVTPMGDLLIIDIKTGVIKHKISICDSIQIPMVYDKKRNMIFIFGNHHYAYNNGYMFCVDLKTNTYEEINIATQISNQGVIIGDSLFIGSMNQELIIQSEKQQLRFLLEGNIIGGFCHQKDKVYFTTNAGFLYVYSPQAEKIIVSKKISDYWILSQPLCIDNKIIVTSVDKNMYVLDDNLDILYSYETGGRIFSSPIKIDDNTICFGVNDGCVYIYNIESQKMRYHQLAERIIHSPICVNNKLVIQDFLNNIYEITL